MTLFSVYLFQDKTVKFGIYGIYGNYDNYIREVAQLKINNLTHKQYFLRTHPRTSPKSPQELVCKSILPENQHSIIITQHVVFVGFVGFKPSIPTKTTPYAHIIFAFPACGVFKKKVFVCSKVVVKGYYYSCFLSLLTYKLLSHTH